VGIGISPIFTNHFRPLCFDTKL